MVGYVPLGTANSHKDGKSKNGGGLGVGQFESVTTGEVWPRQGNLAEETR